MFHPVKLKKPGFTFKSGWSYSDLGPDYSLLTEDTDLIIFKTFHLSKSLKWKSFQRESWLPNTDFKCRHQTLLFSGVDRLPTEICKLTQNCRALVPDLNFGPLLPAISLCFNEGEKNLLFQLFSNTYVSMHCFKKC